MYFSGHFSRNMGNNDYEAILSKVECEKIAKNALDTDSIKDLRFEVHHLSNVTGYLGDYFKITISVTSQGSEKKVHLFAKTLPRNLGTFKSLALNSFKKEEFVYNKYFGLLKSKGFGDILDFTAKFYLSRPDDIVVFEDLAAEGYKTLDLNVKPDYDLMNNFVLKLARFHACSLLLEEGESARTCQPYRIGDEFPAYVNDFMFSNDNETSALNKLSMDTIAGYIIRKFPDIPKKLTMEEFENRVRQLKEEMFSGSVNRSKKYRNVLSHGDAWLTNFLIKTDDSGKIINSILIDFQLIRYNPPVIDLIVAIYLCTYKEFRKRYLKVLLEDYHKELSNILGRYGYDINKIMDFRTFLESFEELKSTEIGFATSYAHAVLIPKDKLQLLKENKDLSDIFYNKNRAEFMENVDVWKNQDYTRRMKELIEDLYEALE